jgi:hypothetical protein
MAPAPVGQSRGDIDPKPATHCRGGAGNLGSGVLQPRQEWRHLGMEAPTFVRQVDSARRPAEQPDSRARLQSPPRG